MVIVVLVVAVIGGMAVFGIVEARGRIRLTNSARLLASYMEKARVDSIRRHAATNDEMAGVTLLNPTSYRVRMDFDGNGTVETFDVISGRGNGFKFGPYRADKFLERIYEALFAYAQPEVWRRIQLNGMAADNSWENAAGKYVELYGWTLGRAHAAHG